MSSAAGEAVPAPSHSELRRLLQLHLEAGNDDDARDALTRLIASGQHTAESTVDWLLKHSGVPAAIACRRLLCDTVDDSIRNRLALAKDCKGKRDDNGVREHLVAASVLAVPSPELGLALGKRLISAGLTDEARDFARSWRATSHDGAPDSHAIELQLLHAAGPPTRAFAAAQAVTEAGIQSGEAMYWAARIFWAEGDQAAALAAVRRAMELGASDAGILGLRGRAEAAAGNAREAVTWLDAASRGKPTVATVRDLADSYLNLGESDEAIAVTQRWLGDTPEDAAEWTERATLLARAYRYSLRLDDALALLTRLVRKDAPVAFNAHLLLADLLELTGRQREATQTLEKAARIVGPQPVCKKLHLAYLAEGRLTDAYAALGNRPERRELNRLAPDRDWNQTGLDDRDLVYISRGGIGDELRHFTAIGDVAARAKSVKATCDPRMVGLLARSFPDITFIPVDRLRRGLPLDVDKGLAQCANETTLQIVRDADAAMIGAEAFAATRPTLASFQIAEPLIIADPHRRDRWRKSLGALGDRPKVAFCWGSGKRNFKRNEFYTRPEEWTPMLSLSREAAFINFQYDVTDHERRYFREGLGDGFVELDGIDLKDDLEDIFAILAEVDLVISPNTALHHFAGSVGAPTLLLTPRPWSYLTWRLRNPETGADCLYPSVTHIRPEQPFDNEAMMKRVAVEVANRFDLAGPNG